MLRYYAATQRQDPRGRVDERADQHAVSWQLFRTEGHWWGPGELHVCLDALPETFREALMRRPEAVCSVGYPVAVFVQAGVQAFVPALLLAASYRVTPSQLVVEVADAEPVINPIWLDMATSRSRWQKEALVEALLPDGEVGDLADIVTRMRNGLATLGGTHLRPALLAGDITLEGEGLRNAAGFFLPSDDRFSRGTERDLEAMQSWPEDEVRRTAFGHLLTRQGIGVPAPPAPAGPMQLTDRQHAAAASALTGPVTLIQGPPGTGKSAVILGLLTSIVLSGRSVLLASKNHQALDEVEGRLAALIDGAPLFTRGRNREGDRDTSFLAQMRALADGETRAEATAEPASLRATLDLACAFGDVNTDAARRTALHLRLSEAVEAFDSWKPALPAPASGSHNLWSSLVEWLRRRFRRQGRATAGGTRQPELLAPKVERLHGTLAAMPAPLDEAAWDSMADALAADVKVALLAIAHLRTTPTRPEAMALAERLKELEFNSRIRQPALTAEDARRVLAHRPVWAISTLSVASRVPLVAGLRLRDL